MMCGLITDPVLIWSMSGVSFKTMSISTQVFVFHSCN